MSPLEIANSYFDLSNKSDFIEIAKLFTDSTTYSSQTTGEYVGVDDIITMQKAFHSKFKTLEWTINSVEEIKPGVILFDYDFAGETKDGEKVASSGLEYIDIQNGKIKRVEIKGKT